MKIMKRLAAFLAAAIVAVSAFAVTASAAGSIFDAKKTLTSEEKVSGKILGPDQPVDYKIKVSKSGTLKITYSVELWLSDLYVYDSSANVVPYTSVDFTMGSSHGGNESVVTLEWNEASQSAKFTATYKVKKGTYYIRAITMVSQSQYEKGTSKFTITAKYPSGEAEAKVDYFSISLKKGSSLELGAVLSGGEGEVTWTTSKNAVVGIDSDGIIKAKKKGEAIITAACGSSSKKIKIIVK